MEIHGRWAGIANTATWGDISTKQIKALASELCSAVFQVTGKSTFKEEFVTAGGVDSQGRELQNILFQGGLKPILCGRNPRYRRHYRRIQFPNSWTGGFLAGNAMAGFSLD